MADTVQVMMEKMVPELEELQARKLFSSEEIQQIVARRRGFEYMMKRIPLRVIDGVRYIEYELNLDALRQKRKERAGLQKMAMSDFAGLRRVHSIFDRLLYKHRGNLDLWLQYIEFCKTEGSSKVLSHVFTRALQVHPRAPELWIEAASYEFSTNLSVDTARVLMQRAIRLNKHAHKLWHEYFRLELLYIQKLTVRRQVLKLDKEEKADEKENESEGMVRLDELPEEAAADKTQAEELRISTEKHQIRQEILKGAIPRIVYKNAVQAIPDDVSFRLGFVVISDLFGQHFAGDLSQFILDSCVETFPENEEVHAAVAVRLFVTEENEEVAEQKALQAFEASVESLGTVTMKEKVVNWIVQRLASPKKTTYLSDYATKLLRRYAEDKPVSVSICTRYVDFLQRTAGSAEAIQVLEGLVAHHGAATAELWLLLAQLTLQPDSHHPQSSPKRATKRRRMTSSGTNAHQHGSSTLHKAISVLQRGLDALDQADTSGHFALWNRMIELRIGEGAKGDIERAMEAAMRSQSLGSPSWCTLRHQYLQWAATALPVAKARQLYKQLLEKSQLLPTDSTRSFLLLCIDLETSGVEASIQMDQVRTLLEKLVDIFGRNDDSVWIAYIQTLVARGLLPEATKVHQRALRSCKATSNLQDLVLSTSCL